jgi:Holliday junction DNA helicase RuvA
LITKIAGKLLSVSDDEATLGIDAFEYSILIPEFARRRLQAQIGQTVSLHTIHYLEGNPAHGKLTPRLVGFLNVAEREFFELFCSVDGVGARKALRAMVRPVREVALLIEEQDAKGLSALPGIGPAIGERIIAKLRRKMPKFALLAASAEEGASPDDAPASRDVVHEVFQILCSLGHTESDARKLLDAALSQKKKFKDVDDLIQAVYQQNAKS